MKTIELTNKALESPSYEWRNFTPAKVVWQQLARDQDEPAPYAYLDQVRVVWDGVTVLQGTIRKCALEQSGNAWRWSMEACDILQPLEAALCFNPGGLLRGGLAANVAGGSSDVDVPRKIKIAGTVQWLLEDARKYGLLPADVSIDVAVSPTAWMWDTALGCDMYAGVLRKLLGGRPGMVCWIDYSGASPVIRVADGEALPVATLDRVRDRLSAINLSPRPDLVPPAVGVVLTAGRQAYQSQVWPRGADLHQEGCVTIQVALPGGATSTGDEPPTSSEDPVWDFVKPIVEVVGIKLPSDTGSTAKKWWTSKISKLATISGLQLGTIKKTVDTNVEGMDETNYSSSATAQIYEHDKGDLSERCKTIKWSAVNLKQYAYTDTKPPKGCEMILPHTKQVNGRTRYYGWLSWSGQTINTPHRKYRAATGESGGEDGSDPPISGGGAPPSSTQEWPDYISILRSYYEITRTVPWEGSVNSLRALSPANLVGRRLAITGARHEYREMATAVQGVSVDLAGESTGINTGVPAHLSLQDMMDRIQQMASGQDSLDQEQGQDGPVQTLQYDGNAYKSPPAPTRGPRGSIIWTEAPDKPPVYDLQVELDWDDDNANVTGYRMRRGKLMLQGVYIGKTPGDDTSGWYAKEGFISGEIWLDVKFNGKGKLTGCSIMYEQGTVNPLRLQTEEADPSEVFSYSFHIATLRDKEVHQHMLGTIQIPVNHGTFYPYGPAV